MGLTLLAFPVGVLLVHRRRSALQFSIDRAAPRALSLSLACRVVSCRVVSCRVVSCRVVSC
eukprot:1714698-Rhodomonas_salina.1